MEDSEIIYQRVSKDSQKNSLKGTQKSTLINRGKP